MPSTVELARALAAAGSAHHDYEQTVLHGARDELWAGFYAAFVLGRLGEFAPAGRLAILLQEVTEAADWSGAAAEHVVRNLGGTVGP